jgi:hypothetical protein
MAQPEPSQITINLTLSLSDIFASTVPGIQTTTSPNSGWPRFLPPGFAGTGVLRRNDSSRQLGKLGQQMW